MDVNKALNELSDELFHFGGTYDRSLELIEGIADWIAKNGFEPEPDKNGYGLKVYMVGAYHYCMDFHNGQNSDEYRILSIIGQFYRPSISGELEKYSSEAMVYYNLKALSDEQ